MLSREVPLCLVATIDDGNVGLNVALQQPRQKLPTAISFVCCQIQWSNSEMAHALKHASRCQRLLTETSRRRFDRQNHTARRVDQIVVVVAQRRWPALDRPGSIWIGRRYLILSHRALFCICHGVLLL